ncbi:CBS domain-containing protein [Cellulosilyticum sp. I15G10I2]|uniref:CBS domain-containing protein n=1 Tax=Cellulosilyticum sp. I15G10I2 TaxID=1892843 RepID=UPI00085C5C52|nr:CBS domain-containing protein [Cellulosilyticum sp. I15G10I2]
MKVKDIMSKEIAFLKSEDSIEKAAQLMKAYNVGSIPVCSGEQVIGIVTDRDITLRAVATGQNSKEQTVGNIMTPHTIVGNPEMSVEDVAQIMSKSQIRRLPIVENNSLVGMVALGDIALEPTFQDSAEDALTHISHPDNTLM